MRKRVTVPIMTEFTGTLLLTDREALLGQASPGKLTVQTPILMDTIPPSGASAQAQMSAALAAFVDAGKRTGSRVTISGEVRTLPSGGIPVIVITDYP